MIWFSPVFVCVCLFVARSIFVSMFLALCVCVVPYLYLYVHISKNIHLWLSVSRSISIYRVCVILIHPVLLCLCQWCCFLQIRTYSLYLCIFLVLIGTNTHSKSSTTLSTTICEMLVEETRRECGRQGQGLCAEIVEPLSFIISPRCEYWTHSHSHIHMHTYYIQTMQAKNLSSASGCRYMVS